MELYRHRLHRLAHADGHTDRQRQREQIYRPIGGHETLPHCINQHGKDHEQGCLYSGPDPQLAQVLWVGISMVGDTRQPNEEKGKE